MNAKNRTASLIAILAVRAVSAQAGATDEIVDIVESLSQVKIDDAANGLDALFSGSRSEKGALRKAADDQSWGGSTGRPPELPEVRMPERERREPPRQETPRQEAPRQEAPRREAPREDPPRLPPSAIPGTSRPA